MCLVTKISSCRALFIHYICWYPDTTIDTTFWVALYVNFQVWWRRLSLPGWSLLCERSLNWYSMNDGRPKLQQYTAVIHIDEFCLFSLDWSVSSAAIFLILIPYFPALSLPKMNLRIAWFVPPFHFVFPSSHFPLL